MNKGILYSNGVVASLSQSLLTNEFLNRLSECNSVKDILDCLEETSFSFSLEDSSLEEKLDLETSKIIEFVKNESPNDKFTQCFLLPFDYENILTFCKCLFLSLDPTPYVKAEGFFTFDQIKNYITTKSYNNFNNVFIKNALIEFDKLVENQEVNGWEIDVVFKKALFENLLKVSQNTILSNLIKMEITLENISIAFRAKTQFEFESQVFDGGVLNKKDLFLIFNKDKLAINLNVDREILSFIKLSMGEKTNEKSIQFERDKQNFKNKFLFKHKDEIETISPFAYYCYRKLSDIKNIRLAFSYVENGLNKEIKKRMLKSEK